MVLLLCVFSWASWLDGCLADWLAIKASAWGLRGHPWGLHGHPWGLRQGPWGLPGLSPESPRSYPGAPKPPTVSIHKKAALASTRAQLLPVWRPLGDSVGTPWGLPGALRESPRSFLEPPGRFEDPWEPEAVESKKSSSRLDESTISACTASPWGLRGLSLGTPGNPPGVPKIFSGVPKAGFGTGILTGGLSGAT